MKYVTTLLFTGLLTISHAAFSENIQVCFAQKNNHCAEKVIKVIEQSKNTLYIQAYQLNSPKVLSALFQAKKRGIKVFAILDQKNVFENDLHKQLKHEAIDFRIESKNNTKLNNILFADDNLLIRGDSIFLKNNKKSATSDVLFITEPKIVSEYKQQFEQIKQTSETYEVFCKHSPKCKFHEAANATKKAADNAWEGSKNLWRKNISKDK